MQSVVSDAIYARFLRGGDSADNVVCMRQLTLECANIPTLLFELFKEHRVCRHDKFWVGPFIVPFSRNIAYLDLRRVVINAVMYVASNVKWAALFFHRLEHTGKIVHHLFVRIRAYYSLKEPVTALVIHQHCFPVRSLPFECVGSAVSQYR
ncbi:hypothetical protein ES703_93270 [subsurface metagenome]